MITTIISTDQTWSTRNSAQPNSPWSKLRGYVLRKVPWNPMYGATTTPTQDRWDAPTAEKNCIKSGDREILYRVYAGIREKPVCLRKEWADGRFLHWCHNNLSDNVWWTRTEQIKYGNCFSEPGVSPWLVFHIWRRIASSQVWGYLQATMKQKQEYRLFSLLHCQSSSTQWWK